MKACLALTILILVAIMGVCVMVKFATDITTEERRQDKVSAAGFKSLASDMAVISLYHNVTNSHDRFPYVAAIIRNSSSTWSFTCFASIILVKWVVTSAHCRKRGAAHRVLLYQDFSRNYSHSYPISLWRLHEKFNLSNPTPKYDIAVAKINVASHSLVVKPSVFDDKEATFVEASVWKTVLTMDKRMYLTNDFSGFDVKIARKGKCFETYGVEIDDSLICVDLKDHNECFMYEFGPIYRMDKVVGVLAVKPRDCDVKLAVFTNVSFYSSWILSSTRSTHYG